MAEKLEQRVKDVGSKLENPPASKDALIELLKEAANCLAAVDQSPSPSMSESMRACVDAIAKPELLKHQEREVKVLVATSLCEITRITAPEAPYSDDVLRDIFHLIVETFSGLSDVRSPSYEKIVVMLETLARYKSCIMMLDLECDDMINEMFTTFFSVASNEHADEVLTSMRTIMLLILEESEDIPENLLFTILSVLGDKTDASISSRKLAMNIVERCAAKLEPSVKQFLISIMSGDNTSSNASIDYHEVMHNIYRCAPHILDGVVPYITGELLTDQLDVRLKAVKLLGAVFLLSDRKISESFQPLFTEFLKRLTDRVAEIRILVVDHAKNFLISDRSRPEAPDIISGLCDRLLDYDDQVRVKVVGALFDVAAHEWTSVSSQTIKQVAERLRDKSLTVKKYTMERLVELYKLYCLKNDDHPINEDELDWIPGKILRCLYDRDFRSEDIELILCGSLFPPEFSTKEKAKRWVTIFSGFDRTEAKALEQIFTQKNRVQQEMLKYLSYRQTCQENENPDYKRVSGSFRIMSRSFSDPSKAEESFQSFNQLRDDNIWRILALLVDPSTSFTVAWASRDELLKSLGEDHPLYDFMGAFSVRCSYLLFDKDYVKEILSLAVAESSGNARFVSSCMNLLPILASFCPLLLDGSEEELVRLLKEDNDLIKEGITHILAKAGGTMREQLSRASSSVDLLLEGLCLEGTRGQAKYAVQALASITKDDGLKSLSVLYKRLVDMLEERTHLPAILQSLGCIAQTAMPIFETREKEIIEFITHNILECSGKPPKRSKKADAWNERSEHCSLKIFAIKTLVRSYLPAKDALLRSGIENLLGILKNILSFGEISSSIKSSAVDKSHLRLASAKAILRLSRLWESKIPVDLFYLTLGTSQDIYPQCRKSFLSKIHQYIKERHLDPKYTCAFLFNVVDSEPDGSLEDQHNLLEIFQVCNSVKTRQLIVQSEVSSLTSYPEYILVYLVHALAHHPTFPDIDKYKHIQQFEPVYRRLHLFLSVLLQGSESLKSSGSTDKSKSILSATVSIFKVIKQSEDVVSREKSKNSYALCDLGLSIIKHLTHNEQVDFEALTKPVTLPDQLYKTLEKEDGSSVGDEVAKWTHREKVLAHFESLEEAKKKKADIIDEEDHKAVKDSDEDGPELPLGEMMKIFKAQGAKKRKMVNMQLPENDVDVLGLVREMKLDEQETALATDEGKKTARKKGKEESPLSLSSSERKPSASEAQKGNNKVQAGKKKPLEGMNGSHVESTGKKDNQKSTKLSQGSQKSVTPITTQKKRSIGGLEKCSSEKSSKDVADLVGCRIKVWWPLDKKFYRGTVDSYDPGKKKHVIVYEDGDVEVLDLQKEKWEVIDSDAPSKKRLKSRHSLSSDEPSTGEVSKGSSKKRKIVERERRNKKKGPLEISNDPDPSGSDSGDGAARPRSGSEVDNGDSGSGGESTQMEVERPDDTSAAADEGDDSENEPLSVWRRRAAKSS